MKKKHPEISDKQSGWSKDAEYRITNRKWLRYSSQIALRVLAVIKEGDEEVNKTRLMSLTGISPEQLTTILKGQQNLSLEMIGKLSEALGVELITFPEYKYSKKQNMIETSPHIKGWVDYLQDTHNEIYASFIFPIQKVINDKTLTTSEKMEQIKKINEKFVQLEKTWDPKKYGVLTP